MADPELLPKLLHVEGLNNRITANFAEHLPPESPIVPGRLYEVRIGKHTFVCQLHSISTRGSQSFVHSQGETLYNMFVYIDPAKEMDGYLTLILRDGGFCNTRSRPVTVKQIPISTVQERVPSYSSPTR